MKILLVDDDTDLASAVGRRLRFAGHECDVAHDAAAGHALVTESFYRYDVLILDIVMPGKSGLELLAELRNEGYTVPTLLLSGLDSLENIIHGLDAGADDYLTKPFHPEELLARLRALYRRVKSDAYGRMTVGPYYVDGVHNVARVNGQELQLTKREFALFELLATRAGQVVNRGILLEQVWGPGVDLQSNVIDKTISKLRLKVRDLMPGCGIESVRHVGFRLLLPEPEPRRHAS